MILQKRWVRILISVIAGAVLQELLFIRTGREFNGLIFIVGIPIYILLSIGIHFYSLYQLQRYVDQKNESNDELLDL